MPFLLANSNVAIFGFRLNQYKSRMVARHVRQAQNKMGKRAEEVGEADSAEEWLRLNVPGQNVSGA